MLWSPPVPRLRQLFGPFPSRSSLEKLRPMLPMLRLRCLTMGQDLASFRPVDMLSPCSDIKRFGHPRPSWVTRLRRRPLFFQHAPLHLALTHKEDLKPCEIRHHIRHIRVASWLLQRPGFKMSLALPGPCITESPCFFEGSDLQKSARVPCPD